MRASDALGRYGEQVAAAHLQADGMSVLARNWRCRLGEIDVVAVDGCCLVVAEVKTRRTSSFGGPAEAVTAAKLARLRRLAASWLSSQDRCFDDVRIDVLAVTRGPRGAAQVEHLRGVG
jgi:putative endonuclease